MSRDDHRDVAAANARFYRAFEALDAEAMESVWAHGEHVKCAHPGWPLLVGWAAVRDSWRRIFASTEEMRFTVGAVAVVVGADLAWVTCTENILSDVRGRVAVTSLLATNLFERSAEGWLMVHHHASPVMAPPPGE
jgi:ketosteroid isomerase-like protein